MANYTDQFDEGEVPKMSFIDHLEQLRKHLVRSAIAIIVCGIAAFVNKEFLFDYLILGPKKADFITWEFFCGLSQKFDFLSGLCFSGMDFKIANIEMTGQFMQHMSVSFYAGIIVAFPYIMWEFWKFLKPALNKKEIKTAKGFVFWVSFLFFSGVLFGYYLLAPISIMFLGTYQVSPDIINQINLSSYISTLTMMTISAGLIFELPVLAYFLAKIGILQSSFMRMYRRHAFVVNLTLAAIITPSVDIASMFLMCLPMVGLYEVSIIVVSRVEKEVEV